MMLFTVLRRFSGSDYLLPSLEEQDRPDGNSKEEQPYFTILSYPEPAASRGERPVSFLNRALK